MAKLEGFKLLKEEDVQEEQRELIRTVGRSLNSFATQVINATNNNLTTEDNLFREIKTFTVTVDSSGSPKTPTAFSSKFGNKKVIGAQVIKSDNQTNVNVYVSGAPFVSFSQNGNIITINNITGLQVDNKYKITIETILG